MLKQIGGRIGAAILGGISFAVVGLIAWYFFLSMDSRLSPVTFAVGGAIIGVLVGLTADFNK